MKHSRSFRYIAVMTALCIFSLCINYEFISLSSRKLIIDDISRLPQSDYCLLPGTPKNLKHGGVNVYYLSRIKSASELYNSCKVNKIIISADTLNKTLENEVQLIKADLLQNGIYEPDLIIDNNGNNTFNSVRHLKKFAGKKITIVSQEFHLERALYISDNMNINAVGYVSAGEPTAFMYLREIFARFKMQIFLIIN